MTRGLKNTIDRYGNMARGLHWLVALLIFAALILGFLMDLIPFGPDKIQAIMVHKSIGLLVLGFALIRLGWRAFNAAPAHLKTHAALERMAAKTIHIVLYICMLAMPLSGWLMSSAGEFSVNFFGLFEMPKLSGKDEGLYRLMREAHEWIAYIIIFCVGLHIAGALKHQWIDRDATMTRMGGKSWIGVGGVFILGALMILPLAQAYFEKPAAEGAVAYNEARPEEEAARDEPAVTAQIWPEALLWTVNHEASAIGISFTQYGTDVSAAFATWTAQIAFDPADLENSHVTVRIDTSSLKTGSDDRDTQAQGEDWFASARFPEAVFESASFDHVEGNAYIAHGTLTLRDQTQELDVPFTLDITEENGRETAAMRAQITLNRLDFGVGQGSWSSVDTIADAVAVDIKLQAMRESR